MSTLRAGALGGAVWSVVLSLAVVTGCGGDGKSGPGDAAPDGRRDGARDAPQNYGQRDSGSSGQACEIPTASGVQIVQPNHSTTINCVTWTCQGDGNFSSSGVACADAGPDLAGRDARLDAGPGDGAVSEANPTDTLALDGAKQDAQPGETGRRDGATDTTVDIGGGPDSAPDVLEPDVQVVVDSEVFAPDAASPAEVATPAVCVAESGQKYYAGGGVCFRCAGSLCLCDANAVIVAATAGACALDAF